MIDIQNQLDERNLPLKLVGITNLYLPAKFRLSPNSVQTTSTKFNFFTDLKPESKGTHLSRLIELLTQNVENEITIPSLKKLLKQTTQKLQSKNAQIELDFRYFLDKKAPVSEKSHIMGYEIKLIGEKISDNYLFTYIIKVPIMLLCPCSKAISKYNAHNQKAIITLTFISEKNYFIEKIIRQIEKHGSVELFPLLKRPDEKYVTEASYENPKFVEDIVRDIGLDLQKSDHIQKLMVECESFESIHDHNAYAKYLSY